MPTRLITSARTSSSPWPLAPEPDGWRLGAGWPSSGRPPSVLATFDLRTERRAFGRHDRTGFTRSATLRLAGTPQGQPRVAFGTLERFAEYCGTGAQTAHGFDASTLWPSGQSNDG